MTKNSNEDLTFSFLVILLGWLVAYPMEKEVAASSWGTGELWLIVMLLFHVRHYLFLAIVSLWHHTIKCHPKLWFLKPIKWMPYCLQLPVYCHVPIMCSHKYCTGCTHRHLWFKTRQHLCSFASTVLSSIKPCIMPPFDSYAFIIGVDNHASRCMDSNLNHFTDVQWPKNAAFNLQQTLQMGLQSKPLVRSIGIYETIEEVASHYNTWCSLGPWPATCIALSMALEPTSKQSLSTSMVHTSRSCQTNANFFGNSSNLSKQLHLTPRTIHHIFLSSGIAKFRLFDKKFQQKFK